ncbi:MAG: hypothetical protein IPP25_08340 [Saprospiraceae bacterium]|nr:hypothetical protein [Candidatus Opimibacter skivensis]
MGHILAKMQERKYIQDMFENEYLYFSFQKNFREQPNDQIGRYDSRDGNLYTAQIQWIEIQLPDGTTQKFERGINLGHADHSENLEDPQFNICCLTICPLNEELQVTGLSDRVSELGDSALVIFNTEKFYDTIEKSISDMGMKCEMRPVKYYTYKEHNGELSLFHKDVEFSFQNEFRIIVGPNLKGDISVPVPGLKSMSFILESTRLSSLRFHIARTPPID